MSLSAGRSPGSASQLSPSAIRRLQRDLLAWERDRAELRIPVSLKFADNNLSTLFINFRPDQGPYKDTTIHVHAIFPPDYPSTPPEVRVMTPGFLHPNVFEHAHGAGEGAFICLDMIKPPELYAQPYSGWSAAYDLSGLVLQLYSFLIGDDNIDQDWGGPVSRAEYGRYVRHRPALPGGQEQQQQQRPLEFKCRCGFTDLPVVPPPSPPLAAPPEYQFQATAAAAAPAALELPNDILDLIISQSDAGTVTKIAEARSGGGGDGGGGSSGGAAFPLADVALRVKQERELVCFYHKTPSAGSAAAAAAAGRRHGSVAASDKPLDADADGDVLGFGVAVVRHRDGSLKSLSMAMDLLSYRAFDTGGVRRSAWNVPFDAFIPLALNARHAARASVLLPQCVARMLGCGSAEMSEEKLLDVLARLMNSLVVEVVSGGGGAAAAAATGRSGGAGVARHMSDAALKGFCHLHHLLLTAALAAPPGRNSGGGGGGGGRPGAGLVARCTRDVLTFVGGSGGGARDGEAARHKTRCPDLGLLLIKYVLVPKDVVPWSTFAPVFVRELLARHVMWVARALGDGRGGRGAGGAVSAAAGAFLAPWRTAAPEPDLWRLENHLKHSRTSLMTVAVEAFFVNALARPAGGGGASGSAAGVSPVVLDQLSAIKATYDKRNGEPPAAIFDAFAAHARSVLAIGKWTEVLEALRLGMRPPPPRPGGAPPTVGDLARHMADALRQAVLDSRRAGYHSDPPLPLGAAPPQQYVDWAGSPPIGVVSDDWR